MDELAESWTWYNVILTHCTVAQSGLFSVFKACESHAVVESVINTCSSHSSVQLML